jgi:TetR/AcrR family transcriptional regulator, transcriptional repressor of aconitase
MAVIRLDSDERRKAIVQAAVPLFARKGFAGTTTRELAEAAGISEALLFKHFPSKQLLYREILRLGCEGDPALEKLSSLQPSTATLVFMVRFMVRRFLLGSEIERSELESRLRLVLHSFLEDGIYASELYEAIAERVIPLFAASLEAAAAAGDVAARSDPAANRFWFAQHVAAMLAFATLPGQSCMPYEGTLDQLVEEASAFILRGIGMSDAAIAAGAAQALRSAAD